MAGSALLTKQNPFAAFVNQQTKSLIERVEEVDQTCSNEHIRRVRVGIKRWRTLYQLVTVLMPHCVRSSQVERAVQRLFKRADVLRDCQQNLQLLVSLSIPAKLKKKAQHFFEEREKKSP